MPAPSLDIDDEYLESHLKESGFVSVSIERHDLLSFFESPQHLYDAMVGTSPWIELQDATQDFAVKFREKALIYEAPHGGIFCTSEVCVTTAIKPTGKITVRKTK